MPPLNTQLMSMTAKTLFMAKMLQLPIDWQQPGSQFPDAFAPPELMAPPNPPAPPYEFQSATLNKYHVNTASVIGRSYASYIDGICSAIGTGIDTFRIAAFFSNVQVFAVSAIGTPGCLNGPPIGPAIFAAAPKSSPQEIKYSKAISNAFDKNWKQWQSLVMVPGLPWYPLFAAFPGPLGPPTPNVPMPLASCPSSMLTFLMPPLLNQEMTVQLGEPDALHHKALFESLAMAFQSVFLLWLPMQMIMNAMGTGPIPTFAPPFVPAGPVVAGQVLPTPGILSV